MAAGDVEQELADAIADVLARHDRSLTTKFVALVEVIDGDGERGLWTFTHEGATAWDTKGMLLHALDMELAGTIAADRDG